MVGFRDDWWHGPQIQMWPALHRRKTRVLPLINVWIRLVLWQIMLQVIHLPTESVGDTPMTNIHSRQSYPADRLRGQNLQTWWKLKAAKFTLHAVSAVYTRHKSIRLSSVLLVECLRGRKLPSIQVSHRSSKKFLSFGASSLQTHKRLESLVHFISRAQRNWRIPREGGITEEIWPFLFVLPSFDIPTRLKYTGSELNMFSLR